jgi:hypothetical protein
LAARQGLAYQMTEGITLLSAVDWRSSWDSVRRLLAARLPLTLRRPSCPPT